MRRVRRYWGRLGNFYNFFENMNDNMKLKVIQKCFDKWNIQKKIVDLISNKKTFHEREIWFIKIGENVGFEQNGKGEEFLRPVIVYKKFSASVFLGIHCLLYTSDAADDLRCVDLGGRCIIK